MARHEYRCQVCRKITNVQRSLEEFAVPPTPEEQECDCADPRLTKILTAAPKASYSGNWAPGWGNGGGKGKW